MASADAVLAAARSQLGYRQAANGSNKFGVFYGMDRVAWCNQFTYWCFHQAGAGNLTPKSAYTPTTYQWYANQGRAGKTPRKGALVFFNWPGDGVNRIQHVGLVEAVNGDGSITTIEGNTSSGTGGSQGNGGGVYRRKRAGSSIVGYGYPAYDNAAPAPSAPPATSGQTLPTLKYGMRGDSRVVKLQQFLNAYAWKPALPLLPTTGNYLDQTKAVVRSAQAQCGVTGADADGSIVGPRTSSAFYARGARW